MVIERVQMGRMTFRHLTTYIRIDDPPGAQHPPLSATDLGADRVLPPHERSREELDAHGQISLVQRLWAAFRDEDFIPPSWVTWRCEESGSAESNDG